MRIETYKYKDLVRYVSAWASGKLQTHLVLLSDGGLGKSKLVDSVFKGNVINSHITPMMLYIRLYQMRNQPIVLRDLDLLLESKQAVPLMKQAFELEGGEVQYHSSHLPEEYCGEQLPHSFVTHTRFLVELNQVTKKNKRNMSALLSRAIVVDFKPTKKEIYDHLCTFAADAEVLSEIDKYYPHIGEFNLRVYTHLVTLKNSGFDWKAEMRKMLNTIQLH